MEKTQMQDFVAKNGLALQHIELDKEMSFGEQTTSVKKHVATVLIIGFIIAASISTVIMFKAKPLSTRINYLYIAFAMLIVAQLSFTFFWSMDEVDGTRRLILTDEEIKQEEQQSNHKETYIHVPCAIKNPSISECMWSTLACIVSTMFILGIVLSVASIIVAVRLKKEIAPPPLSQQMVIFPVIFTPLITILTTTGNQEELSNSYTQTINKKTQGSVSFTGIIHYNPNTRINEIVLTSYKNCLKQRREEMQRLCDLANTKINMQNNALQHNDDKNLNDEVNDKSNLDQWEKIHKWAKCRL